MLLANYAPIAVAIRQAVVNEAPWLFYAPGRQAWCLLIAPGSNIGVLSLPRILGYLTLRRHPALVAGAVIDYERLATVLSQELPLCGEPGQRLKTITVRDHLVERTHHWCAQLRISDLPWAQLPQIEEQDPTADVDKAYFVPPSEGCALAASRFTPGWSGPDLGAPPMAAADDFYASLDPLDVSDRAPTLHRAAIAAYLLRHREAERARCMAMGYAIPAWLGDDLAVEQDLSRVVDRWTPAAQDKSA